ANSISTLLNISPAIPTPTALAFVSAELEPDGLRLSWYGAYPAGAHLSVERRSDSDAWRPIGTPQVEGDLVFFEDKGVTPGGHYGYRLRVSGATEYFTVESWVDVPGATLLALY